MLDALRGIAVILVFCYHSEGAILISRFGWAGVDLFFVLSGFLVSGLLFSEYRATGRIRPGIFLLRRGCKIYPQFWVLIAVTLLVALVSRSPLSGWSIAAELAFVQNYSAGLWTHTWSLGVEEHFYLVLTLALVLLARRGGANPFAVLPVAIPTAAGVILALRVITWQTGPITEFRNVYPSHLRIDSLLCGVLLGYAHAFERERIECWARRWSGWLGPASIALFAPATCLLRQDAFMVTIGFSLVAWSFALLLVSVLYPVKASSIGRGTRALAWLGRVSYAFYLWHGPMIYWTERLVILPAWAKIPLTFALTCVIASLTTELIEKPVLAARDRWFPSSRSYPSSASLKPISEVTVSTSVR